MEEEPENGIERCSGFSSSETSAGTSIVSQPSISSQGNIPSTDATISSQGSTHFHAYTSS
jgi:hypothetical protein